mgnify:CR=1 FL=1
MIESLHIQNIALIEDLTLNLEKGLNILSGETGAGKSIIIDSLNFVLGERADKTLIRNGAERAEVSAVFSSVSKDVEKSLEDLGITPDDVLILKRAMTKDKNECRINGAQVTLGMLKSIGEKLVDIHGQKAGVTMGHGGAGLLVVVGYGHFGVADGHLDSAGLGATLVTIVADDAHPLDKGRTQLGIDQFRITFS